MKKQFLTTLFLLLGVTSSWADDFFTPKTSADYPDEKAFYVTLTVSDPFTTQTHDVVELAAFIGDECRAHATQKENGTYALRVVGDLSEGKDKDKPVVFKVFCEGLLYRFTTEKTFDSADGEFIDLTLDLLARIKMDGPINISAETLPTTYNARDEVIVYFGGFEDFSPRVELESPLTWSMSGNGALSTYLASVASDTSNDPIVPDPILTTTATEGTTKLYLSLTGPDYGGTQFTMKSYNGATVTIAKTTVAVTGITLNPTNITVNIGENINDKLAEVSITVLPGEATDKSTSWDFSGSPVEWFNANDGLVTTYGDYTVTCVSTSNPAVTAALTVHVPQPVSFNFTKEVTMDIRNTATINFTNIVGENFDPSLISVTATYQVAIGDDPFKATVAQDGKSCEVYGKYAGNHDFQVTYDGLAMTSAGDNATSGTVHVNGLLELPGTGWKWVSATYVDEGMAPISLKKQDNSNADFMTYVVEIRTQDDMLYNDAQLGLFGNIAELDPAVGMFKIRGTGDVANIINCGSNAIVTSSAAYNPLPLRKGYNWVTYPHEFDLQLSEIPNFATPQDGDMIIGQTSSAVYDAANGEWVSAGFKFEAGKGYLYYTTDENPTALDFFFAGTPLCYQPQPNNAPRQRPSYGWTLINEGFINNMPVFVRVNGLKDADNYMIGAFVGDECRGEGFVAVDDVMLVNVAGSAGEQVTLRLLDKTTGQEYSLGATISHTSMIGSLRAPMLVSVPNATGISTIQSPKKGEHQIYSISGQRLSAPRKGINIIDGQKVVR